MAATIKPFIYLKVLNFLRTLAKGKPAILYSYPEIELPVTPLKGGRPDPL